MKQKRVERIMEALKEMGLTQMLIVDPMSIYYLTGVYVEPFERFYALYLREDGNHVYFLNKLFTVPEDVGVEKVWYSDTDPAANHVPQQEPPLHGRSVYKSYRCNPRHAGHLTLHRSG